MNKKLKYIGYSIVFQEVPDEVTLAINISGCLHHCEGCHSQYLWEYKGNYVSDDLPILLEKYKDYITCVCFMGGDQNPTELVVLCEMVHMNHLQAALYTGCDYIQNIDANLVTILDYIKLGHYDANSGGLNRITTNQRMYKWNDKWTDITYKFWRENQRNG